MRVEFNHKTAIVINDPAEIVDINKYSYFYKFKDDIVNKAHVDHGFEIQGCFLSRVGSSDITIYKVPFIIVKKVI